VQIAQKDFSGASLIGTVRANTSKLANDGCAPGMVIWVLASHNRRRAIKRVALRINPAREQKLPCSKAILRSEFGRLRKKPRRRREVWTGGTTSVPGSVR